MPDITEKMIPEEVVEAAAMPIYIAWEGPGDSHIFERQLRQWGRAKDAARAAILAALNAWPGMKEEWRDGFSFLPLPHGTATRYSILILPLPAAGESEEDEPRHVLPSGAKLP